MLMYISYVNIRICTRRRGRWRTRWRRRQMLMYIQHDILYVNIHMTYVFYVNAYAIYAQDGTLEDSLVAPSLRSLAVHAVRPAGSRPERV